MKRTFICIVLSTLIHTALTGCHKDVYGCMDRSAANYNPSANISNGICTYQGNVTFWFATNMLPGSVVINGQTAAITQYDSSGTPGCGAVGCANFTLPVGRYPYTATSSLYHWTDTAVVTANGCQLYQLQ